MSAEEWLVVLGVVVAGVWIVGAAAEALIGRTPLTTVLRHARAFTRHAVAYARGRAAAVRLARARIDQTRAHRSESVRPVYRQES